MYSTLKRIIQNEYLSLAIFSIAIFFTMLILDNFTLPLFLSNTNTNNEIKEYSQLINDKKNNFILKKEILKKLSELEKRHTNLTQGMADASDLSALLQLIFDKAWENRIRFDKTTPQAMVDKSTSIYYPVILEMTTDFNKLNKFISSLEAMPQIMRVNRVAVTARSNGRLLAKLLVVCYIAKN